MSQKLTNGTIALLELTRHALHHSFKVKETDSYYCDGIIIFRLVLVLLTSGLFPALRLDSIRNKTAYVVFFSDLLVSMNMSDKVEMRMNTGQALVTLRPITYFCGPYCTNVKL